MSDDDAPILGWLTTIGAIGGAGAALLFALQRFAYERFYETFAVTPEDVGIDSVRVIAASAFALAATAIVSLTGVLLLGAVISPLREPRTILMATAGAVFFPLVIWLGIAWARADDAAKCAARVDGQPVRELRIGIGSVETAIVGIRAERARIDWIAESPAPIGLEGSDRVFLGQVDGTALIYIPLRRTTVRVPATAVDVEIDASAPRFNFDEGCQSTS